MKVSITYTAQVRQAAGVAHEEVELDSPCTAEELIGRLAQQRDGRFGQLLLDEAGRVQPTVLLFVGDEQVTPGSAAPLRDGDAITVLSPIAGGQAGRVCRTR